MIDKSQEQEDAEKVLLDMANTISSLLAELMDVNQELGLQVGQEVANHFAKHWGKQLIYFPCGLSIHVSNRNHEIWKEFTGQNHRELAKKYNISLQWLYRIIKEMRKADRSQGKLFDNI